MFILCLHWFRLGAPVSSDPEGYLRNQTSMCRVAEQACEFSCKKLFAIQSLMAIIHLFQLIS